MTACDGSSSGPRTVEAPIEVTGQGTGGPSGGGGYTLWTDYCECYTSTVLFRSSMRPSSEVVSCQGEYSLGWPTGYPEILEVMLWTPTWTVSSTSTVYADPHLGLKLFATCKDD